MSAASRRRFLIQASGVVFVGVLARPAASANTTSSTGSPAEHVVVIEGMRFSPSEITVKSGDRIVWTNKDIVPHSATADAKAFDSGTLAPDKSWTYAAAEPGAYSYGCVFHPTMKATLRVLP